MKGMKDVKNMKGVLVTIELVAATVALGAQGTGAGPISALRGE